jgi:NitT/TauT family transport system ATP-binding protein
MGRLAVKGVSKIYGEPNAQDCVVALSNVTFEVPDNQFCAVLGHSGCGKTTLLNIAAGFDQPTSGSVMIDDSPIRGPGWRNTMIFQDYALFPWMTVFQNIDFGLEMKGLRSRVRSDITRHYIELVGRNRARALGEAAPAPHG